MTATTERKPAPTQSTPDTIPTANLTAVLAAFNACNLAAFAGACLRVANQAEPIQSPSLGNLDRLGRACWVKYPVIM